MDFTRSSSASLSSMMFLPSMTRSSAAVMPSSRIACAAVSKSGENSSVTAERENIDSDSTTRHRVNWADMRVWIACHSPESVIGMAKTREDWAALVGDMVNQGAQGSDEEFARIIDYLAANFPAKVNVNTAGPQLLESALDLSEKEAAALVAYREQNGKFKSIEDLAKVPGVDRRKIEARKDRIEY